MSARLPWFLAFVFLGLIQAGLCAEAFAPQTYGIDRYRQIWRRSPFIVETVSVVQSAGLATKYSLVGIAWLGKRPAAFLIDRNEPDALKNRFMVSQGSIDGIHNIELVSVAMDKDARKSSAVIKQGGEQASLPFDTSNLPATGPVTGGPPGYNPPMATVSPPPRDMPTMPIPAPNVVRTNSTPNQTIPPPPSQIIQPNALNPSNPAIQAPPPMRRIIRPKPVNVN